jgi:hypothetical protein
MADSVNIHPTADKPDVMEFDTMDIQRVVDHALSGNKAASEWLLRFYDRKDADTETQGIDHLKNEEGR